MRKALLMVLLAVGSLGAQEKTTTVIQVKYRSAEMLNGMLPPFGISTRVSRELNTITLSSDSAEQLKTIAAIIQQYDSPPRQAEFTVRVIEGTMSAQGPTDAADVVPAELKSLLRYTRYALRDVAVLRGMEGDWRAVALAGNMRGRLNFRAVDSQPVQIDVQVEIDGAPTVIKTEKGEITHTPTALRTSASLKSGETIVLGASKMQGGPNALIVLLTAKLLP